MKDTTSTKYRDRKFMLLLYPDNEEHIHALEEIKKSYAYAYILHNKDVYTDDKHEKGEIKKEHYHVVIRTRNAIWNTSLCVDLGLDIRFCEQARNLEKALQYLIHFNDPKQYQYPIEEVQGPLLSVLKNSIIKNEKTEDERAIEIINYLETCDKVLGVTEFARYCAKNGLWADFRRAGTIYMKMLEEHNKKLSPQEIEKSAGLYKNAYDKARFEGFILGESTKEMKTL